MTVWAPSDELLREANAGAEASVLAKGYRGAYAKAYTEGFIEGFIEGYALGARRSLEIILSHRFGALTPSKKHVFNPPPSTRSAAGSSRP